MLREISLAANWMSGLSIPRKFPLAASARYSVASAGLACSPSSLAYVSRTPGVTAVAPSTTPQLLMSFSACFSSASYDMPSRVHLTVRLSTFISFGSSCLGPIICTSTEYFFSMPFRTTLASPRLASTTKSSPWTKTFVPVC